MSRDYQSADIVFNPTTDCLKLPLARSGKRRAWRRERVRHRPPGAASATIEAQCEWTSWHGGDGYGYVPGSGRMPPVTAGNPTTSANIPIPDTRAAHRMTLPTAMQTLATFAGDIPYLVFEQAGFLWVVGDDVSAGDTVLWKVDPADGSIDATTILNSTTMSIASRWVRFDGVVYILLGFGSNVWKVNAAGTVTEAVSATVRWKHAVATRNLLWFTTADNELHSVATGADPFTVANWSGVLVTGDTTPITELAALGRILYIGREDGLNAYDTDLNLTNLIPELADYRDATNCVGMIPWHAGLLVPHSRGLFFYVEGGGVSPVGPEVNPYNTTALRGQFRALLADGAWFWGVLDRKGGTFAAGTGVLSQEAVLAQETQVEVTGKGPIEFFEMTTIDTSLKPGGAIISTVSGTPRIYAVVDGGALVYAPLLATTGAPSAAGTGGSYPTGTQAVRRLPVTDMDQPLASKYLRSVEVDVSNASANRTVEVFYAIDPTSADAALTSLGTVTSSGRAEINFPAGTTWRWGQLAVGLQTNVSTDSPVVWRLALNYADRITKRTIITADLVLATGSFDRFDGEGTVSPDRALTLLWGYEDAAGRQVVLAPNGEQVNVVVLEVSPVEEYYEDDGCEPEYRVTVLMEVVP